MSTNFGSTSSSAGSPYSGTSISTNASSPATSTISPGAYQTLTSQSHQSSPSSHPLPQSQGQGQVQAHPYASSSSPLRNQQHPLPNQPTATSFQQQIQAYQSQRQQSQPQHQSQSQQQQPQHGNAPITCPQLDSYTQALQLQAQQQAMAAVSARNRSISPLRKVTSEEMAMTLGWGGIQQFLGEGAGGSVDVGVGQGFGQGQSMGLAQGLGVQGQGHGMASSTGVQQHLQGSPVQSTVGLQGQQQQQQQPPPSTPQAPIRGHPQQTRHPLSPSAPLQSVGPVANAQGRVQPTFQQMPQSRPSSSGEQGAVNASVGAPGKLSIDNGVGGPTGLGIGVGAGLVQSNVQQVPQQPRSSTSPVRQKPGSVSASTSPRQPPPMHLQRASMASIVAQPPSRAPQAALQKPRSAQSSMPPSRATSVGMDGPSAAPTPSASDKPYVQSRSEPPKRLINIDSLRVTETPLAEMKALASRNRLLLQGDPQIITKQRVETAIRVILDLLRSVPLPPDTPPLPPALQSVVPPDPTGVNVYLERPSTFKGVILQAGTTTKAVAKKQLQAGKTAPEELVYLETAVYMSGENGKRVYACKRCRLREERRRANKDAARKKHAAPAVAAQPYMNMAGEAGGLGDYSPNGMPHGLGSNGVNPSFFNPAASARVLGAPPPSVDYITGVNAEQYDPHNKTQVVEEPAWDPTRADWRHEIVLFNSSPEVQIKDGSCMWLPFRVVCYGKCHGEKVGFRIKFTLRTGDGTIIATSFTDPIRITDDHKTDTKAKPKVEGMTSTAQPAIARGRKARPSASAASSRRQSPAPSESESVQSMSEAGAVMQKQTPSMRGKPYDRPLQSPATSSMPTLPDSTGRPGMARQQSTGSVHSLSALSLSNLGTINTSTSSAGHVNGNNGHSNGMELDLYTQDIKPFDQPPIGNTVSPGALRRPNFGFTSLDGINPNYTPSAPHSATSSNVASPIAGMRPLTDDMMMLQNGLTSPSSLSNAFSDMSALSGRVNGQMFAAGAGVNGVPAGDQMVLSDYLADQDMASTLNSAMDNLFDVSSHASLASSFDGASNSAFSAFHDGASGFYSDSGLVPDDSSMDMEGFLDFSGGQDASIDALSGPPFGGSAQSPFGLDIDGMSPDPIQNGQAPGMGGMSVQADSPTNNMLGFGNGQQAEIQDILSSFSQRRNDPTSRSPEMGMLHHPLSPVASVASPGVFGGQMYGSPGGTGMGMGMGMGAGGNTMDGQGMNGSGMPGNGAFGQHQPQFGSQSSSQQPVAIPPQPLVSHVIPAEGPMAGGTQVAVAGQRFAHGMTVMFGSRVAKTTVVSDSFCTCELPPAAEPGLVEVCVQGAVRRPEDKVESFRYLGMDKEMMRLALEVRDQYQGSSSAAAYRLAQRVAQSTGSTSNSESERSGASPMGSGASPNMFTASTAQSSVMPAPAESVEPKEEEDLQLTIINFLSSLDKHAPGSFRRSGTVNHRNAAEQTLLHLAVVMGFHRLVRRLILVGALLDLQDSNGFTPLAFASLCGQAACARVLIEAGASYDRPTAFGEMPLDLAKMGDRAEVEALLLSAVWSTTATASPTPAPEASKHAVTAPEAKLAAEEAPVPVQVDIRPTQPIPHLPTEAKSEIDDDNPSSSSEVDEEASRLRSFKVRRRKSKGKSKSITGLAPSAAGGAGTRQGDASIAAPASSSEFSVDLATAAAVPLPIDNPPPYEPSRAPSPRTPNPPLPQSQSQGSTWMERTLSNLSEGSKIDTGMWSRLPLSSFWTDKTAAAAADGTGERIATQDPPHGWIALPAPSWETLSRLTSPEEVKMFTQAMAAAALSAVVQSTGGTLDFGESSTSAARARKRAGQGSHTSRSSQSSSSVTPIATGNASASGESAKNDGETAKGGDAGAGKKTKSRRSSRREKGKEGDEERKKVKDMVGHVKQDRMLYLFWLPILLFVSFWLLVTALPLITGFGIIYARQITKAIKQRM